MKNLLLSITLICSTASFACPDFSANYTVKKCSFKDSGAFTPDPLYTKLKYGKNIEITQIGCNKLNIEGESDYNSQDAVIHLKNLELQNSNEKVTVKKYKETDDSIMVSYKIKQYGSTSLENTKTKFKVRLKKLSDNLIEISQKTYEKNLLTLGMWRKGTAVKCVLSF